MDYDGFLNRWLGKAIDWDGVYGPQCVDLICEYLSDNNKRQCIAWANAKDWANHPAMRSDFDWTDNNPNDFNQIPSRGDIIVWGGGLPNSGGYGHIAIWDMVTGAGRFQSLDQNWGGQYVHFVPNHNWDYILGWWTPKPVAPPVPDPIPPAPVDVPIPAPEPQPDPAPGNPVPVEPGTPPAIPDPELPVTLWDQILGLINKLIEWLKGWHK